MKNKYILGIVFLTLQVVSIIYARFIPERFFCWAPYDEHSHYEITVKVNDAPLSEKEIEQRYHYKGKGWEPRAIHNVFNIIEQYETTYGAKDRAEVCVRYSTNGHEEKIWRFSKK
ncbi:MAG: hypothetical protein AAF575_11715 [Bacteroidota bacterium]|nr:hypothetical protein [uncultured Allomuricauda sp.]